MVTSALLPISLNLISEYHDTRRFIVHPFLDLGPLTRASTSPSTLSHCSVLSNRISEFLLFLPTAACFFTSTVSPCFTIRRLPLGRDCIYPRPSEYLILALLHLHSIQSFRYNLELNPAQPLTMLRLFRIRRVLLAGLRRVRFQSQENLLAWLVPDALVTFPAVAG